jgi:energy-coupling factor transport system substrate-specific component
MSNVKVDRLKENMSTQQQNGLARFFAGYGRLTIFMLPIGVAMNFVGGQIASLLKLPIYLDSIGTILVGALCGGLPGAVVGAVANIINSITNPTIWAFALVSVAIGFIANWLSRARFFTSLWKSLLAAVILSLVAGTLGALITLWLFGGLTANGSGIIVAALKAVGIPVQLAVFLTGIPADLVDKILSVAVVVLILRRMPIRLLGRFPFGKIYVDDRNARRARKRGSTSAAANHPMAASAERPMSATSGSAPADNDSDR